VCERSVVWESKAKQVCEPEIPLGSGWYFPWTELANQEVVRDVVHSAHLGKDSENGEGVWAQDVVGRKPNMLGAQLH
jgi:hypothetical protein